MTVATRFQPGARFGPYEIVRLVGVGGMAAVYEARHRPLRKRVAIKVLHDWLTPDPVAAARFLREGRAASAIRHPHVVEVFEVGVHGGASYLVMELLEGEDLASLLLRRGRLSASETVDILLPTASAIAAAHTAGVVHRDIKPSNVFLVCERRTGLRPKVVDFGISKLCFADDDRSLTETQTLLGTLHYMAPEQARSPKNADERSDQYALGAVLYECVTGRKPFGGNSTYELLHAIVTDPVVPPRSAGADIPVELESMILRAMNRDPLARFPSVEAMGAALLAFASDPSRAWWGEDFAAAATSQRGAAHVGLGAPTRLPTPALPESLSSSTLPEHSRRPLLRRRRGERRFRGSAIAWLVGAGLVIGATAGYRSHASTTRPKAVSASAEATRVVASIAAQSASGAGSDGTSSRASPEQANLDDTSVATGGREAAARASSGAAPARGTLPASMAPAPSRLRHRAVSSSSAVEGALRPALSATPSVVPASRSSAQTRVERGFNGAPILE